MKCGDHNATKQPIHINLRRENPPLLTSGRKLACCGKRKKEKKKTQWHTLLFSQGYSVMIENA